MTIIYSEAKRLTKTEQEAAKLFQEILSVSPFKPKGWGIHSNASYYQEKYGNELARYFEKLDESTKESLFLDYSITRRKQDTLLLFINQAWLWLREHHKDKEHFSELREKLEVKRYGTGALFVWKETGRDAVLLDTESAIEASDWKSEFIEFVEGPDNRELVIENLVLDTEQMQWVFKVVKFSSGVMIREISPVRLSLVKTKSISCQ